MNYFLIFLSFLFLLPAPVLRAEEENAKKTATQQVGGLLFDVDEGVKIEQGAGGSVYLRSNKEFMQEKFETLEKRLEEHERRIQELEAQAGISSAGEGAPDGESVPEPSERRVLVT